MNLWQLVILPYVLGVIAVILFIASMLTTGAAAFVLALLSGGAALLAVGQLFVIWRISREP